MSQKNKIVFAGSSDLSLSFLKSLYNSNEFEISCVLTQKARRSGRGMSLKKNSIDVFASSVGITVFTPNKLKEIYDNLSLLDSHILVLVSYGKIIPQSILNLFKFNINVHPSLLPIYRGASPLVAPFLDNKKETAISIMEMVKEMDAGDIFYQEKLNIEESWTRKDLEEYVTSWAINFPDHLLKIISKKYNKVKQNHDLATYCGKVSKNDGELKLKEITSIKAISMLRAYDPWPAVFFTINNKRIKVISAKVIEKELVSDNSEFNYMLNILNKFTCIDGKIFLPLKIIPESKSMISFKSWVINQSF